MSRAEDSASQTDEGLLLQYPPTRPEAQLLWTAVVEVSDPIDLGPTPKGHRFMVPITGGRFYGSEACLEFGGKVLPGGADRQLLRTDGVKELDAIYEMRTDDGAVLSIRNRVIVDPARKPERYAMSVIEVTGPEGPHAWLGRRVIAGTLQSLRPERPLVVIRAWLMDS